MISRGEIWWAQLGVPPGSAPGHRRPVLVVSADGYNRSRIGTVVAVSIIGNLRLADAPGNLLVSSDATGLARDSVVNVSQIATIDKRLLDDPVGMLDAALMFDVDDGVRRSLGLAAR